MKSTEKDSKTLHHQILTETWFHKKKIHQESKEENSLKESSSNNEALKQLKSISKQIHKTNASKDKENVKLTTSKSNANETKIDQIADEECASDDSDIVRSSQDATESRLRRNFSKNLKRSKTFESMSRKDNNVLSPDLIYKRLSMSDAASSVIKEELVEMYNNITDFESIELAHDLSGVVTNAKILSNIVDSPIVNINFNMESIKVEENSGEEELQDPLYIDDQDENKIVETCNITRRKRKASVSELQETNISKKILKVCKKQPKAVFISNSNCPDSPKKKRKNQLGRKNEAESMDESDDELSEQLIQELNCLKVQLQHDVPPQHKIENSAGSRYLDKKQTKQFERYGPLKKGAFTKEEDKIIKKNWENFCEIHNWNKKHVELFLSMRHNRNKYYIPLLEERKNFVRFLANGLPWRSLYSVYYRFKNLYDNSENGVFTEKEDKIIISEIRKASKTGVSPKLAQIAKILNRKKVSVWHHYQKLKKIHNITNIKNESDSDSTDDENCHIEKKKKRRKHLKINTDLNNTFKKVYTNVKWNYPVVKKFIDTLLNVTSYKEIKELKNQDIDESTWSKIEKRLSIDHTLLHNFWYYQLHLQLFSPSLIYLNDTKVKLIEYLHEKKIKDFEDLAWEDIRLHFDGMTSLFLSKLFECLRQLAQTKVDSSKLSDIVEYLYKNHLPELQKKSRDLILPKLSYKNGKIIYVERSSEKILLKKNTIDPFKNDYE